MDMTVAEFFVERERARLLFYVVRQAIKQIGESSMRVSKSQIASRRKRNFALVWIPGQYLKGERAPLVLTVLLARQDSSPRWKEVVEQSPGRFTHHLELYEAADVDEETRDWLREAWEAAG